MARYRTTVRTPRPPGEAFVYMADLRNFARWDPGVTRVTQVRGEGGGDGTVFDVAVKAVGGDTTLQYVTTAHDEPHRVQVEARSTLLTSIDRIDVVPDGAGSLVTYDAELRLNGVLRVFDLGLKLAFDRIGDRAAAGLARALDGEQLYAMSGTESSRAHTRLADIVDAVLEAPVAPSFTKLGYLARKRLEGWRDLAEYDLRGRTIAVTGATSGLGKHAAKRFAALGAHVVVVGRDRDRTERSRDEIAAATDSAAVCTAIADLGELDAVRALAGAVAGAHTSIDALVHNAGALTDHRTESSSGVEATVASQVLGPFLLTSLLLPTLRRAASPGRVITVSSGGMYAAGLTVRDLQMGASDYRGSEQYARAKRAQVTLNQMWATRVPSTDIVFHAMHPGWADTPGVAASLPTFRKVAGPLLRSTEQGADTMVWLAADDEALRSSGDFWHDRRRRSIHKLPSTRASDTPQRRVELWNWCVEQTGAELDPYTEPAADGTGDCDCCCGGGGGR